MADPPKPIVTPAPVIVPPPTPLVGPPPKIVTTGGAQVGKARDAADDPYAKLAPAPATVETTWRAFGTALGVSAPANLARARRAIRSIPGTGR